MIWFCGSSGAGKTELASKFANLPNVIWLDADFTRKLWPELGFSREDREKSCLKLAELAENYEQKGLVVLISAIAPYKSLREKIKQDYNVVFLCTDHKDSEGRDDDADFELPNDYLTWQIRV